MSPYHDETGVDINFWDFGGQEIMHSMHRCFLTDRTCYVVVLSNRFERINKKARYWLRTINSYAKNSPVILAVNCHGDSHSDGVDTQELRKDFPNLGDVVTYSAKCFNKTEFKRLTDKIIKQAKQLDSYSMEFPENWANIRKELLEKAANRQPYIDNQEYYDICEEYGKNNPKIRTWLLEWFNDLGICFSYHQGANGEELKEYKVLSP